MKDTFDTSDTSGTALLLELAHAANRNELTPTDLKWLSQGDRLGKLLPLIRGTGEIHIVKHLIDLATNPFVPSGLAGVEHHEKGVVDFEWDPTKVRLHLSANQTDGKTIEGNKLRKELASELPFNANLLDYLLKNPHLIPEEWKKDVDGNTLYIYFWGTIYRNSAGDLCVRYLCWCGGEWVSRYDWLGGDWDFRSPAACLAK
jgi:hypothetical protein